MPHEMTPLPAKVEILSYNGSGIVLLDGKPFPLDTSAQTPLARVDYPVEDFPILWMPIALDFEAEISHRTVGADEWHRLVNEAD